MDTGRMLMIGAAAAWPVEVDNRPSKDGAYPRHPEGSHVRVIPYFIDLVILNLVLQMPLLLVRKI